MAQSLSLPSISYPCFALLDAKGAPYVFDNRALLVFIERPEQQAGELWELQNAVDVVLRAKWYGFATVAFDLGGGIVHTVTTASLMQQTCHDTSAN